MLSIFVGSCHGFGRYIAFFFSHIRSKHLACITVPIKQYKCSYFDVHGMLATLIPTNRLYGSKEEEDVGWKGKGKNIYVYYFLFHSNPHPPPCCRIRDTYKATTLENCIAIASCTEICIINI